MRTIDEAKQYFEQLANEAGLDEASKQAILGSLGKEKFAKGVLDGLARHDEMSSAMDKARNAEQQAAAKISEYQKWYSDVATPAVAKANQIQADLDRYRTTYGDLSAGPTGGNPDPAEAFKGKFASPKDVENIGNTAVQVAKALSWIQADHLKRFGDVVDPDEFEKFAVSRGLPPKQAYQEFIAPKVAEKAAKEKAQADEAHANALKAAREEGIREGMTRKQWNGETSRTTDVYGRDKESLKQTPEDAEEGAKAAFLDEWTKHETAQVGS